MKAIFLDLDGVVNSADYWMRRSPAQRRLDEKSLIIGGVDRQVVVPRLNRVTDTTGACFVISSTIRKGRRAAHLREFLAECGITGRVVGMTPVLSVRERGHEIQAWLDMGADVETFAIIDDDSDMAHLASRLVKTTFEHGMLDEHADRLIELLGAI